MTNVTVADIPEILRPRLWRPIIIFRTGRAPILFGPGALSTPEALVWIDNAAKKRRYARGGWREATRAVALSAPIPILDGPRAEVDRMRTRNRKAAMQTAVRMTGNDNGPAVIWAAALEALADDAGRIESLALRLPGATRAKVATSVASLLLGTGRPMQRMMARRTWPKAWLLPRRTKNAEGLTAAAVLDWRNSRQRWPVENDQVGERFMRKMMRLEIAQATEGAARRNEQEELRTLLLAHT